MLLLYLIYLIRFLTCRCNIEISMYSKCRFILRKNLSLIRYSQKLVILDTYVKFF